MLLSAALALPAGPAQLVLLGLLDALRLLPLASIAAALVFLSARQSSRAEIAFAE